MERQQPAILVQKLSKSFGSYQALKGLDLQIESGETVVLFGPNGTGKTTLIKLIATILNPTAGKIIIGGMDTKDRAEEIRRRIGILTHQTFLYNNLTAQENLEFYARIFDVAHARERIKEVIAMVGMTTRTHERVGNYSRGMQQRISIARLLLHDPPIMLLDEPETGLDQEAIAMLWQAIRTRPRTVLMTTHSLERGLELSERLLIMARGKIAYQCPCNATDIAKLRQIYQENTAAKA